MRNTRHRDERRRLLAQASLDLFNIYVSERYDQKRAAHFAVDALIGSAIAIGHAEGRHMTAGDIAVTIGLPRSTVIKKLGYLVDTGVIEYRMNGRRKVASIIVDDDSEILDQMEAVIHRLSVALRELSETDSLSRD